VLKVPNQTLAELIKLDEYGNYYTGSLPFVNASGVCHRIKDEDVCVAIGN
jgi:hypothetical protein